jgi:hypothetical protein
MVEVLMLRSARGSPNGKVTVPYLRGETYDIPDHLADVFCHILKCAEYVGEKSVDAAPENKAVLAADANKAKRGRGRPRKKS